MEKLKKNLTEFKGLLIDLDGTIYSEGKAIPGSIETVSKLRDFGLKFLFLTNTDSKAPSSILKILKDYGFKIKIEEIFTPIIALKEFLLKNPNKKSFFVTSMEVEKEFHQFHQIKGSELPDFVIIGDFRDNWDVNRLNLAFKYIIKGAKLLGTQGNRYFLDQDGEPVIDTGSFVQMIATSAKIIPKIFGKPSKEYFLQALEKLRLNPEEVTVIGDDLETDIQGAINANMKGILVKTGKGKFYDPLKSDIKPYLILESINSIIELF